MNAAGQIAATLQGHAAIWQNGVASDLGPGAALAINAGGQAVGYALSGNDVVATRWDGAITTTLRSPEGPGNIRPWAINAGGRAVGQAAIQPVSWTGDAPTVLPLPAIEWDATSGAAYGINDEGQIVGWAYRKMGFGTKLSAVLWQGGSAIALDDFVPPAVTGVLAYGLLDARAINNAGQIVGTAYGPDTLSGYLLTPTPAPVFGDVPPGDPAAEAIAQLTARGIIKGCDSTALPPVFCPDDITLRHQMAALIVRAMPGWAVETYTNTFTDPTEDAELWSRVATLQHYGVVTGYTAESCVAQGKTPPCYGPLDPVLRAQAISFVTRAMIAHNYWTAQAVNPGLYGGALNGTGHEQDAATYWHYTRTMGGVPDYPEGGGFSTTEEAPRDWFARLLWTALDSALGR